MSDLMNNFKKTSPDDDKKSQQSPKVEPKAVVDDPIVPARTKESEEVSKVDESTGVKDPDSWSKDSALKEVTKLREESKMQRLKYAEQLEKMKAEVEEQYAPLKNQVESFKAYKDELDAIKTKEEDKKRSLEEKMSHRESRISELESVVNLLKQEKEGQVSKLKEQLSVFEAQESAREELYRDKLKTELGRIPEKFREHAELIAKGAGDASQALVAINEARLKGLFEDRTVVVNHQVPGANSGARANKEQLDEAARAGRDSMSSAEKVASALKNIRSGQSNSAFRTK